MTERKTYWLLIWLLQNISLSEENLLDKPVICRRDHRRGAAAAAAGEHE
jgi:hypothetical protein